MDLTDKHPTEFEFHNMIKEVKSFLENFENQFVNGDDKEIIKSELEKIKQKLFDLQMERFAKYINDRGKVENMPAEEEKIQREMTELIVRLNRLIIAN